MFCHQTVLVTVVAMEVHWIRRCWFSGGYIHHYLQSTHCGHNQMQPANGSYHFSAFAFYLFQCFYLLIDYLFVFIGAVFVALRSEEPDLIS